MMSFGTVVEICGRALVIFLSSCQTSSMGLRWGEDGGCGKIDCYDSFTYSSSLIFLIYSLHAPASCLLFLVYILISFYRLSFLSCTALLFLHSLMHSMLTHAQSCTVCLLIRSLLRCSLVTQYIRTG